jgi:hypothetical protein
MIAVRKSSCKERRIKRWAGIRATSNRGESGGSRCCSGGTGDARVQPAIRTSMSAIPTDDPAADAPSALDAQQQLQQLQQDPQLAAQGLNPAATPESARKRTSPCPAGPRSSLTSAPSAKAPSVRRACVACHTGKTRCSEALPCQVPRPPSLLYLLPNLLIAVPRAASSAA